MSAHLPEPEPAPSRRLGLRLCGGRRLRRVRGPGRSGAMEAAKAARTLLTWWPGLARTMASPRLTAVRTSRLDGTLAATSTPRVSANSLAESPTLASARLSSSRHRRAGTLSRSRVPVASLRLLRAGMSSVPTRTSTSPAVDAPAGRSRRTRPRCRPPRRRTSPSARRAPCRSPRRARALRAAPALPAPTGWRSAPSAATPPHWHRSRRRADEVRESVLRSQLEHDRHVAAVDVEVHDAHAVPRSASAAATLMVTRLLPTPPLVENTVSIVTASPRPRRRGVGRAPRPPRRSALRGGLSLVLHRLGDGVGDPLARLTACETREVATRRPHACPSAERSTARGPTAHAPGSRRDRACGCGPLGERGRGLDGDPRAEDDGVLVGVAPR